MTRIEVQCDWLMYYDSVPAGSPSSTVISVLSVILMLLLMGTSFLIVPLRKRRKTQVTGESTNKVTAYSGGGVRIKCKYEEGYETNVKYFCKGKLRPCADQIKTGVKHTWVHEGRFSLYDNTSAKVFWVLMRNLTVEDTGTYQCGVDKYLQIDTYTVVEVKVKADLNYGRSNESGYIGGTVNVSCKYPEYHRSDPKFLCKIVDTDVCTYNTSVKESEKWINEEHTSLYDDRTNQILTVTIRDVTEQDSGTYWCGAESDWESDHGYMVYMTQIYLRVIAVQSSVYPVHLPPTPAPTVLPRAFLVYSFIGVGLLLVTVGVITAVYCKIRRQGSATVRQTNEDYVNFSTFFSGP
ncbi:polymeric immunoglobulin receptor-like [Brachyhypopomus gauderio]|uniref:polymeric immunoglobulin receptor-like n=1 Tax=Brachyhypopomus gauderio TaxID=698409 RepID=UPI0040416C46